MNSYDLNYVKYVGYNDYNDNKRNAFTPEALRGMSKKITQLLQGVGPNNRPIVVPLKTIGTVLSSVFESYNVVVGDIYSRYILDTDSNRDDVRDAIDRSINIIVSQIKNEYEFSEQNKQLTIWDSVLGDFNVRGLRSYSTIKTLQRHPEYMQFQMHY